MASNSFTSGDAVLIANVKENKLYIDNLAFNKIMDKVGDFPMSVVSINGPFRSGKSYMLGYFLRFLSAFENDDWFTNKLEKQFHWKNSPERQTTGILMWSEPLFIERNGKKIAILLIDTQGCFDEKSTGQESTLIFALSCLLSSVLIFNVKSLISEDTLQNLHMFIGYARMTESSERSESDDSKSFPKLIFLVRDWECPNDFEFGYYDDITPSGSKNYLKEKLGAKSDMVSEAQLVRKAVLESFDNVGCCLMSHPGKKLANFDNEDDLDPEFIKTIKEFIPRIFDSSNICLKKIGNKEINGDDFKGIVQNWAKCFEQYNSTEVKNLTEAAAEFQHQKALSIGLKLYRCNMSNELETKDRLSEDIIEWVHKKYKEEAIAAFNRINRIKHRNINDQYMQKLEDNIQEAFEFYRDINRVICKAQESEIKEIREKIIKMMKNFEISQENSTNTTARLLGYFTVRFVNETDSNIKLYWLNYHFWRKSFDIESKVTKSCTFYAYDNLLWSTKYEAIIKYDNKEAKFWAFGQGAPKGDNDFTVKSDGIYLCGSKHSNWQNITSLASRLPELTKAMESLLKYKSIKF